MEGTVAGAVIDDAKLLLDGHDTKLLTPTKRNSDDWTKLKSEHHEQHPTTSVLVVSTSTKSPEW